MEIQAPCCKSSGLQSSSTQRGEERERSTSGSPSGLPSRHILTPDAECTPTSVHWRLVVECCGRMSKPRNRWKLAWNRMLLCFVSPLYLPFWYASGFVHRPDTGNQRVSSCVLPSPFLCKNLCVIYKYVRTCTSICTMALSFSFVS